MSHESTYYGLIDAGEFGAGGDQSNPHFAANRTALDAIPKRLFLSRTNFHLLEPSVTFRSQLIQFAGTANYLEGDWGKWLEEFEAILRVLCWVGVDLHVSFDQLAVCHQYAYELCDDVDVSSIRNGQPVQDWLFSGGPREFPV